VKRSLGIQSAVPALGFLDMLLRSPPCVLLDLDLDSRSGARGESWPGETTSAQRAEESGAGEESGSWFLVVVRRRENE